MGSQDEPTCPLPGLAQDNADACNFIMHQEKLNVLFLQFPVILI
jgi:hypothetical protein